MRVETIDILKRVDWALYRSISPGMKLHRQRERERERERGNIMVIGFRNMNLSQKWWLYSPGPALLLCQLGNYLSPKWKKGPKILEKNGLAGKKKLEKKWVAGKKKLKILACK